MSLVSTRVDGRIAIVTIDNPPVSTGNARFRADLHREFSALRDREDVDAAVVRSAQAHFYSGSDISEFDGEITPPSLPDVIALVDSIDIPVVAALQGLTLGGGLEFALACDVRVAASDARVGLPEVTLGMLPGAGGTVRLPRLVGVPRAVGIVTSGVPVRAPEALEIGLVDEVVDALDLETAAIAAAGRAVKRRARLLPVPESSDADVVSAVEAARKGGRARPNVVRAAELVVSGAAVEGDEALRRERAVFDELRLSDEARNLRYLFFAKRAAAKDLTRAGVSPAPRTVGIAGAGTMGSKIAESVIAAGVDVVLYELAERTRERARDALTPSGDVPRRRGTLTITGDLADLAPVDLFIDAVFEDATVKRDLFTAVEPVLAPRAIIASNTSYLNLDELGTALSRRGRFIGIHFFNPADRNPLLEVVRTRWTTDETVSAVAALVKRLSKTPILAGVADGFVANSVYSAYRTQAEFLVEDGATPAEVDDAMRALGLPIGPFAVADMSGLDIAWARRKRQAATRNPDERYVTVADSLCEAGRLGRKTGAGWYRYDDESPNGAVDPVVDELIDSARAAKGITPRMIAGEEIQQRIVCSMVVAASRLIESKTARRASDVDVALTEGFAFPKWLGGPLRYASMQDEAWVREGLVRVRASDPSGFEDAVSSGGEVPAAVAAALESVRPEPWPAETSRA